MSHIQRQYSAYKEKSNSHLTRIRFFSDTSIAYWILEDSGIVFEDSFQNIDIKS